MTTPGPGGGERSAIPTRRTIAYITATRAEYGLARRSLLTIAQADDLELRLIVTGDHLDATHGHTLDEITHDGLEPAAVIPIPPPEDGPLGTALWVGSLLPSLTAALLEQRPDVLLIIGDRFEALAAAQAAALCGVPVAHVHGGELTSGSLDDGMRHAITHMAVLHLTAAPEYARRVIQLGADPNTVHVVGAPGIDGLDESGIEDADGILRDLGLDPSLPFVLATYHPATAVSEEQSLAGAVALTQALDRATDLQAVITGVNSDPGSSAVREVLSAFVDRWPGRAAYVESLGHRRYLVMLAAAAACLGNSSSGMIEAPATGTPTINIGPRQDGRLRAPSITDVGEDAEEILAALHGLRRHPSSAVAPGGAAASIVLALRDLDLTTPRVRFHDCGPGCDSWALAGAEPGDG